MIKYLIIDDESIAHDIIKGYCDLLTKLQLQKNCYDAIEALDYLAEHQVDLIFLDLNMPKLKGFEFLRTLTHPPKVIVTTAYSEFALEGYELNVVDYLLKPFSFERFLKAVNKAIHTTDQNDQNTKTNEKEDPDTIFLKSNKKYLQVRIDNILFMESEGNYVKVITTNETIPIRSKLSDLLTRFPSDHFLKVHKSFAVAKNHIKKIEGNRIFINEHQIPIGRMYRAQIDQLLS